MSAPKQIRVDEKTRKGFLDGSLGPMLRDIARDIPGKRRWVTGGLQFELSRVNIEFLRTRLPDVAWEGDTLSRLIAVEAMEDEARKAKALAMPAEAGHFRYKTTPRDHQKRAFLLSRDREAYGLFLEQGLGKTKVIFDTAAYLWSQGKIDTLLVVAPNGVHAQWIEEQLPLHLPDWVPRKTLIYGSREAKLKRWQAECEEVFDYHDGLRVIVVNQEALAFESGVEFVERVLHSGLCLWAIDESNSIQTPGARRTKSAMRLRNSAKFRRILTGTPVARGVENLYSQLKWLSDDVHGCSSFAGFRNQYCETVPNPFAPGAVRIVGYKNLDDLKRRMDPWCLRVEARDCLDLPERIYSTRYVALTDEQTRLYREVRTQLLTQLQTGEIVTADQAIVKLLRLQQIVLGHVKDENGKVHRIPNNRIADALAAANEASTKVVIWACFHEDIDQLVEASRKAGRNPAVWDGRNVKTRGDEKRRFINDETCRDFIANQGSAGIGVDGLQHVASTMIYYSNTFKARERWQSEARLWRDGQRGTVNVVDLVARGTVDAYVLKTLQARDDVAKAALRISERDI